MYVRTWESLGMRQVPSIQPNVYIPPPPVHNNIIVVTDWHKHDNHSLHKQSEATQLVQLRFPLLRITLQEDIVLS